MIIYLNAIGAKPRKLKLQYAAIGFMGIVCASAGYYCLAYKYRDTLPNILIIANIVCWVVIWGNLLERYLFPTKAFWDENKFAYIIQKLQWIGCAILMVACIIVSAGGVMRLETNRERDIMANQPTATTQAMVTRIETMQNKNLVHRYVHLIYQANGKTIMQETEDNHGRFTEGKRYPLKYSVRYPEIFFINAAGR